MKHQNFNEVTRTRIAKWQMTSQPVDDNPTWIERRQAIVIGGKTHLITNGQVFQCAHCGHYDPEWSVTEVLDFYAALGVKPIEIEVTCSVALDEK